MYQADQDGAPRRGLARAFSRHKRGGTLLRLANYLNLIFWAVLLVVPYVWLLGSSFKDMRQFYAIPLIWFPWPVHWENYRIAMIGGALLRYIFNSAWLAALSTILTLFTSSMVAYGFSRFKFPGRDVLMMFVIASMMLPSQATWMPVYMFFRRLGLIGTFYPLIIPYFFGSAFAIFLLRQFFINLPASLDEAATIDGCGSFGIFWRIILPQAKPVLVTVALNAFLGSWGGSLFAQLIYLNNPDLYTLPIGLLFFVTPTDFTRITAQLAAVVIALLPTLAFFLLSQRQLDRGVIIATVK